MRLPLICLVLIVSFVTIARADDWPQWLGPKRDSVWRETGIVDRFPKDGLKVKWRKPVALGYAGPAVAGGKVYVADFVLQKGKITNTPSKRDKLEGLERVLCFDAKTGAPLWEHKTPRSYDLSFGGGPRCTPTVDDDRVFALGAEGNLFCLNADKGNVVWQKDFKKDFGAKTPIWGFTAHPLVHGDLVYCVVGGQGQDSLAIAFNKHTGKVIWKALAAQEPGYCPPTVIEQAGQPVLTIFDPDGVNGLDLKSGKLLWSVPLRPDYAMSIAAPRQLGNLLYVSGYQHEAKLLKLAGLKDTPAVVWTGKAKTAVYCDNSTPFLENGVIYGVNGDNGTLMAASLKDGKRLWQTQKPVNATADKLAHGTAYLVKHQDRFLLFNETGDLILARLSPEKYEELSRFHVLEPTNPVFGRKVVWSHPAFAEKCCFARNDAEIVCVSLAKE